MFNDNLPTNTMCGHNFSDMYIFAHGIVLKYCIHKTNYSKQNNWIMSDFLISIYYKKPPIPINGTRGFIKARLILNYSAAGVSSAAGASSATTGSASATGASATGASAIGSATFFTTGTYTFLAACAFL